MFRFSFPPAWNDRKFYIYIERRKSSDPLNTWIFDGFVDYHAFSLEQNKQERQIYIYIYIYALGTLKYK
jgi:hypothetical protein